MYTRQATGISMSLVFTHPAYFIATLGGVGLLPIMPGTWATAVTVLAYQVLHPFFSFPVYCMSVVITTLLAIPLCGWCARKAQQIDPPELVIDEWIGLSWTFLPTFFHPPTWWWLLLAFGLFRFFDICKPGLIGQVDRCVHGGIGIILDDVLAGLASGAILFFLYKMGR